MPKVPKPIADNTFEVTLLGGDNVEIGDKKSTDFKPHIKLNRWDGECFVKIALDTAEKHLPTITGSKIHWEGSKIACEFLPTQGGYKFNIIFKEKPDTNVSLLNFESQELVFYYQHKLTPKEITEGCRRPENVVGSYAVYHATRTPFHKSKADAEKYKICKAFHWYRPLIWDATGKKCWGELNVDPEAGIRTVTVPQDFLDTAVYPVTMDDEFGYHPETPASNILRSDLTEITAFPFSCPAEGTITDLTAYWAQSNGDSSIVVYDDSTPSNRVDYSSRFEDAFVASWRTSAAVIGAGLAIGTYYLGWCHAGSGNMTLYYDDGSPINHEYELRSYVYPPPATFSRTASSVYRKYGVYVTYTTTPTTPITRLWKVIWE